MCMSSGGGDGGAAEREAARQAKIQSNMDMVNTAFDQYDGNYYDNVRNTYLDYFNPQLTDKYTEAKKALQLALAQQGILSSTAGADKMRELDTQYKDQQSALANSAIDEEKTARQDVESQRASLISQAQGGGNMDQSALTAQANAMQYQAPTGLIGDVFATLVSNAKAYAQGNAVSQNYSTNNTLFSNSDGSGRTVS